MAFHIIGDRDTILGYRFAGATGTAAETREEALTALQTALANPALQILMVTEKVGQLLEAEIVSHRVSAKPPYIVAVGDIWDTKVSRRSLEDLIHEAVGIKIVKEQE